jgi:uncharacterized membrane protein YdjX (TVP38/TMEM64 family)
MTAATRHLLLLVALLLAGILVPFWIYGERFDAALSVEGSREWMAGFGAWAWAAGMGLLVGDIVLPVPSTVVMSALGWMYGWFWGGVISAGGSVLSGLVAYGGSRWVGRPAARWIAGEDGLKRAHDWFERGGGWLVVISRWMPVMPEAVACLAGLARMRWRTYWLALVCGSLPLGFAFAAIGHLGHSSPGVALGLSAMVPAVLWWAAQRWRSRQSSETESPK